MKTSSMTKSLMVSAFMILGSAQLVHAHTNYISYPISCMADDNTDRSIEIQVSIVQENGLIVGNLVDHGDRAHLKCQEILTTGISLNYLECTGQWASDGSDAKFSTPLFTYTPMTSIQRSSSVHGAQQVQGACL